MYGRAIDNLVLEFNSELSKFKACTLLHDNRIHAKRLDKNVDQNDTNIRTLYVTTFDMFEFKHIKIEQVKSSLEKYGKIESIECFKDSYSLVTFLSADSALYALNDSGNIYINGKKMTIINSTIKSECFRQLITKSTNLEVNEISREENQAVKEKVMVKVKPENQASFVTRMLKKGYKIEKKSMRHRFYLPYSAIQPNENYHDAKLYFNNIPSDMEVEILANLFFEIGQFHELTLVKKSTESPKNNFGFVNYLNEASVWKAIFKVYFYFLFLNKSRK